jgi:hypothetical protein
VACSKENFTVYLFTVFLTYLSENIKRMGDSTAILPAKFRKKK